MLDLSPQNTNEGPKLSISLCVTAEIVWISEHPTITLPCDVTIGWLVAVVNDLAISKRVTSFADAKDNTLSVPD